MDTRKMVKNKRILKEIARRFAKAALHDSADFAFSECGLSREEEMYIIEQIEQIAEKITPLDIAISTEALVNEYFD